MGRHFYCALSFLVTQTDVTKFFSASRDFRGGGSLAKSRSGGGG